MSNSRVTVDATRIRRLITALSCASFDRFDSDAAVITPDETDDFGMLEGVLAMFIDELAVARATTERALGESEQARAELEERLRVIDAQRATISELSTPIIDVWDQILTMPIIGTIDTQRAAEISDRLLSTVAERGAEFVLLDLTGVAVLDTATASHIVRLTQGVRLLGAECILTGISPQVAQTLAMLGVDWRGTQTMRSLREALRYCLGKLRGNEIGEEDDDVRTPARRQ